MNTILHPRCLTALLTSRRASRCIPTSIIARGLADRTPHHQTKNTDGNHLFNLKKLGATPTVRFVVYGALGVAAVAETTFWCSWLWAKVFVQATDSSEQRT